MPRPPIAPTSRWRRVLTALVAIAAVTTGALAATPAPAQAATRTIVSLTFDDANADQLSALPALKTNGMRATFYVPSGFIDAAGHMSRADLTTLKNAGHEIGGHTVTHPDLAAVSVDEAKRQICTDRKTLTSWGFSLRSFAYPFASSTPDVEKAAAACGYNSARGLGDIRSRFGCPDCAYAESTRPADPYYLKALDQVDATWTLDDLKAGVTNAEKNGGGWVQFTFHDVCDNACSDLAVTPAVFSQFTAWLKTRASAGTVVKTVGEVIGGAVKPVVDGPTVPAVTGSANGVVNPSLEQGAPDCWMRGGYGSNSPAFSTGSPAHTGVIASAITMSNYVDGDAKLLPQFDLGQCAPTVSPGRTYTLREWYQSSGVTQFAVYLRSSTGAWSYWTSSPWFAAAADWTQADWTTPAIPAGYTGISFALTIFGNGTLRTDDLQLYDSAGAPALPAASTTSPTLAPSAVTAPQGPVEVANPTESVVAG
ncbi:polysaccharide deacetylase family protein [uncultured Microbacterium sp.]|uniref:polysaccharide deacetylase family protein n=1 Tax=uncultured Microbacterium sp. TaxID=191216 RepID=UPI0025F8F32E|nr:polysaccharide deacetylase family protein [uncultured Microbacterium sp.]